RAIAPDNVDSFTIDTDFEFFVATDARLSDPNAAASNPEIVFAVQREGMLDEHSTASAERQTFDVIGLCQAAGNSVSGLVRADFGIADGQPADLCCSRDIPLDK